MTIEDYNQKNSQVRFLQEMGPNMQKIIKRLLANKKLLRLLYYTDKDPLSEQKEDVSKEVIYKDGITGLIRVVPRVSERENSQSIITFRILRGNPNEDNSSFLDIYFFVEIFCPLDQWVIKDENLRPYAIMSEVQQSLEGKEINGLGTISGSGFDANFFTEEIGAFYMRFRISQFQ